MPDSSLGYSSLGFILVFLCRLEFFLGLHFGLARLLRVFESYLGFVESLGSSFIDFVW